MFYVNGKQTPVKELVEKFKIPVKERKVHTLKLVPRLVRIDRENGGLKHPVGIFCLTAFTGTYDGEEYEIRYSKAAPRKDKHGNTEYTPRKLEFSGNSMVYDMATKQEEFVYMYLYPRCQSSPFYNPGEEAWYAYEDRKREAGIKTETAKWQAKVLDFVLNENEEKICRVAKGLKVTGVDDMSPDEVREAVLALSGAEKPEEFYNKLVKATTEWFGVIEDAIDKGVITKQTANGVDRWHWKDGRELVIVPRGSDAKGYLHEYVVDNFDVYQTIYKQVAGKSLEDKIEGVDTRKKVNDLLDRDLIYFDRATKTVYWTDGDELGEKIAEVTPKGWIDEVVQVIEGDKKLLKTLNNKHKGLMLSGAKS